MNKLAQILDAYNFGVDAVFEFAEKHAMENENSIITPEKLASVAEQSAHEVLEVRDHNIKLATVINTCNEMIYKLASEGFDEAADLVSKIAQDAVSDYDISDFSIEKTAEGGEVVAAPDVIVPDAVAQIVAESDPDKEDATDEELATSAILGAIKNMAKLSDKSEEDGGVQQGAVEVLDSKLSNGDGAAAAAA